MHLDRLDRDEQRLRDLLCAHPVGGQLHHPPLARGERVQPGPQGLPRPGTGGGDLLALGLAAAGGERHILAVPAIARPLQSRLILPMAAFPR